MRRDEIIDYSEGGMSPELFWHEYVASRTAMYDNYKDVAKELKDLEKIKAHLDKNKKLQGISGEELQEDYNYFNDNKLYNYTWRSWGALMSAYMNTKEKKRKYNYMSFYMK
jgi:hypothetical protein